MQNVKAFKNEKEYKKAKARCNLWERTWRKTHPKQHTENSKDAKTHYFKPQKHSASKPRTNNKTDKSKPIRTRRTTAKQSKAVESVPQNVEPTT